MKKKQYVYEVDLVCDMCGVEFKRSKHNHKKLYEKWGYIYCKKCAHALNNKRNADKQRQTHLKKMKEMSVDERKRKYGNDTWKRVPEFIAQQKLSDGHGESVRKASAQMTVEERREKWGRPGELNPMYGKPIPEGSGIGYSGWYKGIFFRSKMELSYILYMKGHSLIPAEPVFSIKYVGEDGKQRTYRPDFIVGEREVVEIKPKNLVMTEENQRKMKAAVDFYETTEYSYRVVTENDFPIISFDEMWEMYQVGSITLTKHSEKRMRKKYESKVN